MLGCASASAYDGIELIQVLDTHCEHFHTLTTNRCAPDCTHLINLVQAFSKGFRFLDLHLSRSKDPLRDDLGFLQWCPWLKELGLDHPKSMFRQGIGTLGIIKAMDKPWEFWNGLEALRLNLNNHGYGYTEDEVAHHVYQLFIKLRSLPKLRTLSVMWYDKPPELSLAMLNRVAKIEGSTLMTKEDLTWMGLQVKKEQSIWSQMACSFQDMIDKFYLNNMHR
jgi:hypothetical protein